MIPTIGKATLKRVRWLPGYSGTKNWVNRSGAKAVGHIALANLRDSEEQLPHQSLQPGEFDIMPNEFAAFARHLYLLDGRTYIVGDIYNYPVRAALYEVTVAIGGQQ